MEVSAKIGTHVEDIFMALIGAAHHKSGSQVVQVANPIVSVTQHVFVLDNVTGDLEGLLLSIARYMARYLNNIRSD